MRHLLVCASAVAACAALLANASVSPATAQHAQEWKCTGNPDVPWDQQITNCTNAIRSGKYAGADIAWAYYNRAIAYHRGRRDLDRAMEDYDEAIRLDPSKATYHNNRAIAYRAKGELDLAIADYDHAIRLDPQHASAYHNRANVQFERGELDLAIADYTAAIRVDPKYAIAYRNRGEAYQTRGDLARAIADYGEAIGIAPRNEASFLARGRAEMDAGMLPEALADLNRASELEPKDPYAALWLDIANKRGNLPGRLAQAAKTIDMTAWPAPVIRLYLGQLTPEAVLAAADDANPRMKQQQVCEANYFTGELALQQRKADEAKRLFALVAADCRKSLTVYADATAELKALGARP
jgi:tetratricopeptide (TPR) repeat protein